MREIEESAERGDERARFALDVYAHRLVAGVAAMAASLGGLDGLAFTGGVGEHSDVVRQRACEGLAFLGVETTARAWVIPAREDLEIARGTRACLAS